jgi:hypothetical protein
MRQRRVPTVIISAATPTPSWTLFSILKRKRPWCLYRAEYGERQLWVRPLDMFIESVNVDGQAGATVRVRGRLT